jgi:uncharacterized protein
MTPQLTRELFVIHYGKNFILYAPLKGAIAEANPATISLLQQIRGNHSTNHETGEICDRLLSLGILEQSPLEEKVTPINNPSILDIAPTSVTLFPTTACNLKCVYCYASGGEEAVHMNFEIAKSAIDFIIGNAIRKGSKTVNLGFHGGGEPFCNFDIVKRAVEYYKEQSKVNCLKARTSSATNGVLDPSKLEWAADNMDRLNISLDGPEDIQNLQRPTITKGKSFEAVMKSIAYLESRKKNFGLRATITRHSVDRMVEIVDFFSGIKSLDSYHIEPLFECGRCKKTEEKEPNPALFLQRLTEAREHAKTIGKEIYYSGGRLVRATRTFCGAAEGGFNVTPTGMVTSCYEVSDEKDPRAKIFIYGKYTDKHFEFYPERLARLNTRIVDNLPHCTDCFAKFCCAGDCLAKTQTKGSMFDTSTNSRCQINRGSLLYELNNKLKRDNVNGSDKA